MDTSDDLAGERPVFVVGMRRSGTTLVFSMIGAHPSIAMPRNESNYFSVTRGMRLDGDIEDFDRVWPKLTATRFAQRLDLDLDALRDRLRRPGVDHRAAFGGLLREHARATGKPRWGDKSPGNERHLGTLWDWYPEAQVIYMLRDPRAVIASLFTVPWQGVRMRRLVDGFAVRWRETARLATAAAADERALVVRYEDLVRSPEAEVARIFAFLHEPYVPAVLEPRSNRQLGATGPRNTSPDQAVNANSLDKWRSVLSPRETAIIEHITRREMLEHGFAPDTAPAGPVLAAQIAVMGTARKAVRSAKRARRSDAERDQL